MGISIVSITLGICVMIWSFAVTTGFRKEIREKVVGFGAHIEIHFFDNNASYEKRPFPATEELLAEISGMPNVRQVQVCASKAGIVQTESEIEGLVFKGIGPDYDSSFFARHLVRGRFPDYSGEALSNDILISEHLAGKLQMDTGQKIRVYFVQEPVRQRNFRIVGIYNTGLGTYDETFAICSLRHIQKLNGWGADSVDALEILLDDFNGMEETSELLNRILPYDLLAETTKELHPDMFEWISLFDQNVAVLVILMMLVVCISLISTQLTLILEHIPTIGILRTLGCSPKDIRNIFLYICGKMLLKGMLFGNLIAISACLLQERTHLLRLNPQSYFVDYVPMTCQWQHILGINVFVLVVSLGVLLIPAHHTAKRLRIVDAIISK